MGSQNTVVCQAGEVYTTATKAGMPNHTLRKTGAHTEKKEELKRLLRGAVLKNGSTFVSGTKIVPQEELSYGRANGSSRGAVLAPLFFSVQSRQCI